MQIRASFRQLTHRVEQVVTHVAREVGDELDALQAGRVVKANQQVGKAFTAAVAVDVFVAVDRLAEEVTSLQPSAASWRTSAAMCSGGRLCSGPRTLGTMQ